MAQNIVLDSSSSACGTALDADIAAGKLGPGS